MQHGRYLTNDAGDVWGEQLPNGTVVDVDPDSWGWGAPRNASPDWRRTRAELAALPGFTVEQHAAQRWVPGPRPARSVAWDAWREGAAPPAAARSKDGVEGTLAYFDRLSDAFGHVARRLPVDPTRSPFRVDDFIAGCGYRIGYKPPAPVPGSRGSVYVVSDGDGIKIGHTTHVVARRIGHLQTGNPRTITALATINGAGPDIEARLHRAFGAHHRSGEWFHQAPLLALVDEIGGWEPLLRDHLGGSEWLIDVHRPCPPT